MEQRQAEDTKNLWRILVVVVITGALLFWVMNMGEGDPAPAPGTPPPPGVGAEPAPDEVEALDNGPLHRPPGTGPADIRRPASAPYDDFDPDERRPEPDDADEEESSDDGSDPRSEDDRPSTRPVPPGFQQRDDGDDVDDDEERSTVADAIRDRDDIQSARKGSIPPQTRANIRRAAEALDDVDAETVDGVLDDLELSDEERQRLGDDPVFADEMLEEFALSDKERQLIQQELTAPPYDHDEGVSDGDTSDDVETSRDNPVVPDELYSGTTSREYDRDVASDAENLSDDSAAGSSHSESSAPERESDHAHEDDDYADEGYTDVPPSSLAAEEYSDTLDEAHYVGDPTLYSAIATQGLAEALYLMSAGRTHSENEAARQRDELLDRTHATGDEHTDDGETDDQTDDDATADEEDNWTVWLDAVDWLRDIQQQDYPELADMVDDVEDAAEALDPELPEEEQADELAEFFELVELVLEAMAIEDEQFWEMSG